MIVSPYVEWLRHRVNFFGSFADSGQGGEVQNELANIGGRHILSDRLVREPQST
jgi:hypothetical protein